MRSYPLWPLGLLLVLAVAFLNARMWADDRLVWGVPVNLAYHVGLCVATTLAAAWMVRGHWRGDGDE